MAICAYDVALTDLCHQPPSWHQHRAALGQAEQLACGISMVEVHLMGPHDFAAIGARSVAVISQQRDGSLLASPYTPNLLLAIPPVVSDVGRTLAGALWH